MDGGGVRGHAEETAAAGAPGPSRATGHRTDTNACKDLPGGVCRMRQHHGATHATEPAGATHGHGNF